MPDFMGRLRVYGFHSLTGVTCASDTVGTWPTIVHCDQATNCSTKFWHWNLSGRKRIERLKHFWDSILANIYRLEDSPSWWMAAICGVPCFLNVVISATADLYEAWIHVCSFVPKTGWPIGHIGLTVDHAGVPSGCFPSKQ